MRIHAPIFSMKAIKEDYLSCHQMQSYFRTLMIEFMVNWVSEYVLR